MRSSLARIAAQTHGHRRMIALGALFILLGTCGTLLYPPIIGKVMDLALQGATDRLAGLSWLCAALTVVLFSRAVFSSLGSYLLDRQGTLIVNRLKERIFSRLVKNDYQYFSGQKTGDLISRIQVDTESIRNVVTHTVAGSLNHVFVFIGAICLMLLLDWKLTLLVLALAPVSAAVSSYFSPKISRSSRSAHAAIGASGAIASEVLTGIQTVKSFRMEGQAERKFWAAVRLSVKNSINAIRLNSIFSASLQFSTTLTAIGIFWYGGIKVIDGLMSAGTLLTFLFYSENLTQGFLALSAMYGQIAKVSGASSRAFELLNIETLPCTQAHFSNSEIKFDRKQNPAIMNVHKVGFTYANGNHALSNISFCVGENEVVGLVGPSGCGKSTLAHVVSGLYRPSCGHIEFNDETIGNRACAAARPAVVLVPQDTFIFNDSIWNNIHMVAPDASRQEVLRAAELACVTEFSNSLPAGMDAEIGERGSCLSGGQRQRIGLARALLLTPKLLILDESTSALDADTEMRVIAGIMAARQHSPMSVIMITHRKSLLQFADSVLKMVHGEIIWRGSAVDYLHQHGDGLSANQPIFALPAAA